MQLSIDIGTCFSKASFVSEGVVTLLKDSVSHAYIYPSSAYIDSQNKIWTGGKAENQLLSDPLHYYRYFKADLGNSKPYARLGSNIYPETLISAMMWQLKGDAEQLLGYPLTKAVVAMPGYYKEEKRKNDLIQGAAKHVGFSQVELLEETIAVAAYYNAEQYIADGEGVLVY